MREINQAKVLSFEKWYGITPKTIRLRFSLHDVVGIEQTDLPWEPGSYVKSNISPKLLAYETVINHGASKTVRAYQAWRNLPLEERPFPHSKVIAGFRGKVSVRDLIPSDVEAFEGAERITPGTIPISKTIAQGNSTRKRKRNSTRKRKIYQVAEQTDQPWPPSSWTEATSGENARDQGGDHMEMQTLVTSTNELSIAAIDPSAMPLSTYMSGQHFPTLPTFPDANPYSSFSTVSDTASPYVRRFPDSSVTYAGGAGTYGGFQTSHLNHTSSSYNTAQFMRDPSYFNVGSDPAMQTAQFIPVSFESTQGHTPEDQSNRSKRDRGSSDDTTKLPGQATAAGDVVRNVHAKRGRHR
jgi:hypothetical protein